MRVSGGEGEVTAFGEQKCCNQPQCGGREAAWRLRQGRRILEGTGGGRAGLPWRGDWRELWTFLLRRGQEGPGQWPGQRGGSGFDGPNEGPGSWELSRLPNGMAQISEPGTHTCERVRAHTHARTCMHTGTRMGT